MEALISTNRLILRHILMSDLKAMFELDSDPKVHQFLGNNPIKSIDQAQEIIENIQLQYEKYGMGRLAIAEKATNSFVGWAGIKYETKVREFHYYDVGYRLIQKYWGQGYATEAAKASLEYGFNVLNLPEICGAADVAHTVSNKILSNIGMKLNGQFIYEEEDVNWYVLSKNDWTALTK